MFSQRDSFGGRFGCLRRLDFKQKNWKIFLIFYSIKNLSRSVSGQPNFLKMKKIYTDYASYNLWANRRLAEIFAGLPEEKLEQHVESSFPSAKLTFLHIWDAELIWLKRLQGTSLQAFPSRSFNGTTAEVFEGMLGNSSDFLHFIENQPDDFFPKTMQFTTINSGAYSQQAYEMIHHCMNHSTYHRGQLVTIGRQLGLNKIPPTDLIFYLREK
jgi:uncharacterized damage-inducible protein DinB